jgi:3-hydroxyisobutyrate dehydrogenase
MDAVKSVGTTAPLGSYAAEIYAKSADHADKDFSAVIEMIRNASPARTATWPPE